MTRQIKHYIEITDVLGLRFACKSCGTTVSFPISQTFDLTKLGECPCCKKSWIANASGASIQGEIEAIIRSVRKMADIFGTDSKFPTELQLTIEVKAEAVTTSALAHDSIGKG